MEPRERNGVLLQLAESLEVGGDWSAAEDAVADAREAAESVGDAAGVARARTARAELDRKQGRYAEAEAELEQGRGRLQPGRRRPRPRPGDAPAGHAGLAAGAPRPGPGGVRGEPRLRQQLGDEAGTAALLTNLALVAEDEGDLDAAERLGEEGLSRRRRLGDRRAVSVSLTNMGMLATVRGDLQQALARFAEAADPGGGGRRPLGGRRSATTTSATRPATSATWRQRGGHFGPALTTYVEHDDLWSLAHLFEDVAVWLLARGAADDAEAISLLAAAESAAGGDRRPAVPPTQEALDEALRPAGRAPRPRCSSAAATRRCRRSAG